MLNRRFAMISTVFVILLLPPIAMQRSEAGYGVQSKRPPSDPRQASVDERIVGAWRGTIQGKTYFLHIGRGNIVGQFNWMELALIHQGKKQTFYLHHKTGFAATVGKGNFFHIADTSKRLNQLRDVKMEELISSVGRYDVYKYDVTQGYLDVWPADQNFVKEAIKAGKIKGNAATIDDTPGNLNRFIESSGAKLFGKPIRFVRVE